MSSPATQTTTRASRAASKAAKAAKESSEDEAPQSPSPKRTRSNSPSKKATDAAVKKESFKWNTPADEFADDVASDAEDDEGAYRAENDDGPISAEIDGEQYEAHRTEDGGIVIHLGPGNAAELKGETHEDIQSYIDNFDPNTAPTGSKEKSPKLDKQKRVKQKFKCPKCDKVWNWPWELRRHVLTHYKEKERQATSTFKCEECGRGFQWKRDLAQHQRLHTGEKLLVCSVCEKKFTTRQALLHHVVVHTGEKPFQCALCGNRFTQPANLRTHMKKKHSDTNIVGNKCPHCQESFPSIIAVHQHILEDHQNIVAEQREEQSMKRLAREQEKVDREKLKEENRKKRVERRKERIDYNDFRGKGLQEWEINYEFHIGEGLVRGVDWDRTPSNGGELNCEICDRKFGWRYEVMFHNLCHKTDEHGNTKNRVCPECDTAFKVPIGLKHHLLLHTGELPFLCLHCWRSFASHIDLKLHIRKEHLSHLDASKPNADASTTPTPTRRTSAPKVKRPRKPKADNLAPTQHIVVSQEVAGVQLPENMEVMVAGENQENQTILLGADGTIVQTGDQDMIVVIQSEDFDQSQGLIVVDPDQLQHVVGQDGTPVTLVQAPAGSEGQQLTTATTASGETKIIVTEGAADVNGDVAK